MFTWEFSINLVRFLACLRNRTDAHDSFRRDSPRLCRFVRRTTTGKNASSTRSTAVGHDHKNQANPHCGLSNNEHNPDGVEVGTHTTLPVEFKPTHTAISVSTMMSDSGHHDGADHHGMHQQKGGSNHSENRREQISLSGVTCLLNHSWQCDRTKHQIVMIPRHDRDDGDTPGESLAVRPALSSNALLRELDIPVTMKQGMTALGGSGFSAPRRKTEDGAVDLRNLLQTLGPSSLTTDNVQSMQNDHGDDDLSMGSIDYPDSMLVQEGSLGSSWAWRPIDGEFSP